MQRLNSNSLGELGPAFSLPTCSQREGLPNPVSTVFSGLLTLLIVFGYVFGVCLDLSGFQLTVVRVLLPKLQCILSVLCFWFLSSSSSSFPRPLPLSVSLSLFILPVFLSVPLPLARSLLGPRQTKLGDSKRPSE